MDSEHDTEDVFRSLTALLIAMVVAAMALGAALASLVWWLVT